MPILFTILHTLRLHCTKWDGNPNIWHTMHDKLVAELSQMRKLYLLFELMTTPQNASDSKLLNKDFWDKFSGKALSHFADQAHEFLNKGIEMYRVLLQYPNLCSG